MTSRRSSSSDASSRRHGHVLLPAARWLSEQNVFHHAAPLSHYALLGSSRRCCSGWLCARCSATPPSSSRWAARSSTPPSGPPAGSRDRRVPRRRRGEDVLDRVGLGSTATTGWQILRLPLAAVLAVTCSRGCTTRRPLSANAQLAVDLRWRRLAVAVWLVASLGLSAFAATFGTHDATYGTFATAILPAVWLWLTAVALLLGAEVNAARRRHDERPDADHVLGPQPRGRPARGRPRTGRMRQAPAGCAHPSAQSV